MALSPNNPLALFGHGSLLDRGGIYVASMSRIGGWDTPQTLPRECFQVRAHCGVLFRGVCGLACSYRSGPSPPQQGTATLAPTADDPGAGRTSCWSAGALRRVLMNEVLPVLGFWGWT